MRNTRHSRRWSVTTGALVTAGVMVLVAACSASKKSAATSAFASASASASAAGDGAAYGAPGQPVPSAAASSSAAAGSAPASLPPGSNSAPQSLLKARDVIYTADITVRSTNVKADVARVQQIAEGTGGNLFSQQVDLAQKDPNNQGVASATVVIHVPPGALTGILTRISQLGVELDRNQHAEDVTAQVVDVDARARAAQNSLNRLNELFAHAGTVAELTSLEQQIAQREADRDSLLSQQKTLAAQVAQATITVNLVGTPPIAAAVQQPKKAHVFGFLKGLRGGWHAFTKTVSAIATAFGALLPFLVIGAVLAGCALFIRRRFMQARRSQEPPSQPEPVS